MKKVFRVLKARYPQHRRTIELIEQFREIVERLPFEGVANEGFMVSQEEDPSRVIVRVEPSSLQTWATHISLSCQVRMHHLEEVILTELADRAFLPSLILVRAHMETAGLAAKSLRILESFGSPETGKVLPSFMAKTLLGTSLRNEARWNPLARQVLSDSQPGTITIKECIESLDFFAGQIWPVKEGTERMRSFIYSWLCNFSHPNSMSRSAFTPGIRPDGTRIVRYSLGLPQHPDTAKETLAFTFDNMTIGYLCAASLGIAVFKADGPDILVGLPKMADMLSRFTSGLPIIPSVSDWQ